MKSKNRSVALLIAFLILASPLSVFSQQKRPAAPIRPPAQQIKESVPTFDSLLGDETYRIYSEVRNVGSLVRSQSFNDLLDPVISLTGATNQFSTIVNWMKAHADPLAGSRIFVASWPSKKTLPLVLFGMEFPSAEEAKKFESELKAFLPKLDPKSSPAPSPAGSPAPQVSQPTNTTAENRDSFSKMQVRQLGGLVLISDKVLVVNDLKQRGVRLLAENPNFALARNRFASEAVFLYVDFKAIEKEEEDQRRKWEEEEKKRQAQLAASPTPLPEPSPEIEMEPNMDEEEIAVSPPESASSGAPDEPTRTATLSATEHSDSIGSVLLPIQMALFSGQSKWPEAIGAALAFEDDGYILRALVVNKGENRSLAVPFIPQLLSGPAIAPASPAVLPANVDLFLSLSVDYLQIYESLLKSQAEQYPRYAGMPANFTPPSSPFADFEKKAGLKLKEDVLPLLGNEIGIVLPKGPGPQPVGPPDNEDVRSVRAPELMPVIAIAVKDKETVKRLIPQILDSMGAKGASMLAHTEKRADTEIVSYANLFAYAFIGDFLIISPEVAVTRNAVDSYLSQQTLASESRFRNATRWQTRQLQGQVYITPDFVESYVFLGKQKPQNISSQANLPVDPLTYSLSNEGVGPIHELHVPRNLLMMVVAAISSKADESPIFTNESIAKNVLRTIAAAEATFRTTKGDGRYGTVEELAAEGLLMKDMLEKYGYKIEVAVVSNKFEVTATPLEYGKTGKRSFFIDESSVLRGGDHGGGAATLSDKPIDQ